MTIFLTWPFKSTGSSTSRILPDRLAEAVNVKDFGAVGNGIVNDTSAVQAAFDAAFGSSSSPNGTNGHLNRTVYFPGGNYMVNNLLLTQVYGGRIIGAGNCATTLTYNGSVPGGTTPSPILKTNGFQNSSIEHIRFISTGRSSTSHTVCLELDWDNSGSIGLSECSLIDLNFQAANYGFRVAHSGFGGRGISGIHIDASNCYYGYTTAGDDCTLTTVGGGSSECYYGVWVSAGSYSGYAHMTSGAVSGGYPGQTDILHDSAGVVTITGARSESANVCKVTNASGKLFAIGIQHGSASAGYAIDGSNGAEVSFTSCMLGEINTANTGRVTGNVKLSLRNVNFVREGIDTIFSSFTGTVVNYQKIGVFTFATLPPNPAEGLTVNVSDADLGGSPAKSWGDSITAGGGSGHALLRWNGSAWKLVGI